jgi:hypothetical protein
MTMPSYSTLFAPVLAPRLVAAFLNWAGMSANLSAAPWHEAAAGTIALLGSAARPGRPEGIVGGLIAPSARSP